MDDDLESDASDFEDDGGDGDALEDPALQRNALPRSIEAWRKRTAMGAIMTGIALGLQQVFDPEKRNQPAIVQQRGDEPDDDKATAVSLDGDNPSDTVFKVRPWLFDEDAQSPKSN